MARALGLVPVSTVACAFAALAGACGAGDSGGGPDAAIDQDGDLLPPDAAAAASGLGFEFHSDPELPGEIEGSGTKALLVSTTIDLVSVRAIGDSAPGDERTTRDELELEWEKTSTLALWFADAPPGIYSSLLASVTAFTLVGTVEVRGDVYPFLIEDEPPSPLSVSVALMGVRLDAGADELVTIDVDLDDVVKEVDWPSLEPGPGGVLLVDDDYDEIDKVRTEMADAFERQD
jgi:hypothetical protein